MKKKYLLFTLSLLLAVYNSGAQTSGCTDPLATNYNPSATRNDGSCIYDIANITPTSSFNLVSNLAETSGLILWNNQLWTHNDNKDINIYALDTLNGNLIQSYPLNGIINTDWEDISQDENYIYIGDFGNNSNGNRKDLKILRITKNSILLNSPKIDTINFSYSDQVSFTPTGSNNTDFDCEAFIVSADSIFLFTKQWISNKTSVYALPKTPGTYSAKLKSVYDVQGLITGATYIASKKLLVLCGYSSLLEPFLYVLYDFNDSDFFSGNKREITISLPFHQVEGITTTNGLKYYISNEYFSLPPYLSNPQKLHILELNSFLKQYLETFTISVNETEIPKNYVIYPVPARNYITIITDNYLTQENYCLINQSGQVVFTGQLSEEYNTIDISDLSPGIYLLKIGPGNEQSFKVIKR